MYPHREEKNSTSTVRRIWAVFGPKIARTASRSSNPLKKSVNRWYFTGTTRGKETPTDFGLNDFAMAGGTCQPALRYPRSGTSTDLRNVGAGNQQQAEPQQPGPQQQHDAHRHGCAVPSPTVDAFSVSSIFY